MSIGTLSEGARNGWRNAGNPDFTKGLWINRTNQNFVV